jgi:hypothetical protein
VAEDPRQLALPAEPDSLGRVIHELASVANILTIDHHVLEGFAASGTRELRQLVGDLRAAADRLPGLVARLRAL